ncbi:MAG: hypothetical protein RR922_03545 [Clostridia bacterium]
MKKSFSLGTYILNSFNTLVLILGFTIIFSILSNIFVLALNYLPLKEEVLKFICAISTGIFEMTSGILKLQKLNISYTLKMCLASFISSFGGLSVIFQIYTVVQKQDLSFRNIFMHKVLHGILSAVLTYILISTFVIFQSPYLYI